MDYREILISSENDTIALGKQIAARLNPGMILSLVGPLGAGKTVLAKGIVAGLGGDEKKVFSPTFSLVNHYDTPKMTVLHCDFYRLPSENGLDDLGGIEFFYQDSLYLIEWLETQQKIVKNLKKQIFIIEISVQDSSRGIRVPSALLEKI